MKKFLAVALTAVVALGLAGCGTQPGEPTDTDTQKETEGETADGAITLKVGASPSPHADILKAAQPLLEEQGITLDIVEFNDYVLPNKALDEGDLDANFFQHKPYLDTFNAEHKTELVSLGGVHFEPMGIFAGKTADLESLPDGAIIGVPNDPTNEARALMLLEANGLLKLKDDVDIAATKLDIAENPKNFTIQEMDAAQLPLSLDSLDIAVINGNFALSGGLKVADALAIEAEDSLAATTYANIVVARKGDENKEELKKLVEALQSEDVKTFINDTFSGAVKPIAAE